MLSIQPSTGNEPMVISECSVCMNVLQMKMNHFFICWSSVQVGDRHNLQNKWTKRFFSCKYLSVRSKNILGSLNTFVDLVPNH